jgi:hypothetical protein
MKSVARSAGVVGIALAIGAGACRGGREGTGTGAGSASAAVMASGSAAASGSGSGSGSAVASAAADDLTRALADVEAAGSAAPDASARGPKIEQLVATIVAPKVPDAAEALAKGKWRFRGCAIAALAEAPGDAGAAPRVEGSFTFELLFDGDGRVATAKPKVNAKAKPPAVPSPLETCLATALTKIAFASPTEEGARGEVSITLRASRPAGAPATSSASSAPSASRAP